jgi:hypothetical protein
MGGGKEKKKTADRLPPIRGKIAETSETKAFPNREPYKTYFIEKAVHPT